MMETTVFGHDGVALAATLYRPDDISRSCAAVVGAPGFGGTKEMGLPAVAERLAAAGIATLLFDYAGFGASAGEPRQHVDPWSQVAQFRSALDYLGQLPGIDANRLGVFGPSLAGGHALHLAATDARVRAAVAIVPFVEMATADADPAIVAAVMNDAATRVRHGEHHTIPIVGRVGELAVLTADGALDWVRSQSTGASAITNAITLASLTEVASYRPLDGLNSVGAATRVIVAEDDTINPATTTLEALSRLTDVDIVEIGADHFSVFDAHLAVTVEATADWLGQHLSV